MENRYWWHDTNLKKLEKGEYFVRNEALEKEIGNLIFTFPNWDGPGLSVRGSKGGSTTIFQHPMNCGHLIMGNLAYTEDAIKRQDFIVENLASCMGYGTITASAEASIANSWLKYGNGWQSCGTAPTSRYTPFTKQMTYMIKFLDINSMYFKGYAFNEDKFVPAGMNKIETRTVSRNGLSK